MSRPSRRRARRRDVSATPPAGSAATGPRSRLFWIITLLTPVLLLAALEAALRVAGIGERPPLFVMLPDGTDRYLVANVNVGRRWFRTESLAPAPQREPFAVRKPDRGFRVFVLGESTTAGFPYPANVTFSRLLRDVLRDTMSDDSVEVVNLGVAATSSYAMVDMIDEVADQRPDAVLIYAGHNEYYGVLGTATTGALPGVPPALKRAYLMATRFHLVGVLQAAIDRAARMGSDDSRSEETPASFMETLAGDRSIELGGTVYRRGARQFGENLDRVVGGFREKGIPVFVASLTSNLRDQGPLASPANGRREGADSLYARALAAAKAGDSALASRLFREARDRDVVRFRAPSEFNDIIRRVAASRGAVYVPIDEEFARVSPGGIPGSNVFLEHVHPNRAGYALMAAVFYDAMKRASFGGRGLLAGRERSWDEYEAGMTLTWFDEQIALHGTRTLTARWPFVTPERQLDYPRNYRPTGKVDSLALLVARGAGWAPTKLQVGSYYERRGAVDSAVAEYRGLARDFPISDAPLLQEARAYWDAGRVADAEPALRRAMEVRPSASAAYSLGVIALRTKNPERAIPLLQQALRLEPGHQAALYQLSFAYALSRDLGNARAVAATLARLNPHYPGLKQWLDVIWSEN